MNRLEILVEEKSMKEFLLIFLPKILPSNWKVNHNCFIRSFEGKSDLQKSIPKQIRAFAALKEKVGVLILQDQDSADCKILKSKITNLITDNSSSLQFKVRIVCKELESWYLGDFKAIEKAYPKFKADSHLNKAKYRNPDILNASQELRNILPEFQKISSAKRIAPFIDLNRNTSESLNQFVNGLLILLK